MSAILVVEDDLTILNYLKERAVLELRSDLITARSLEKAKKIVESGEQFSVALLDLHLQDAPNGEIVDYIKEQGIPVIVMTGSEDAKMREEVLKKEVLDYVFKSHSSCFDYAFRLIKFLEHNSGATILVVDDSLTSRLQIKLSLQKYPLTIIEAKDGVEALAILKENDSIRLMITDKNMPNKDGIELLRELRTFKGMNDLAVIGMTASNEPLMSVEFLKNGANDFVHKPYQPEELVSRVLNNLEMQTYIKIAQDAAVVDFLTGLNNRKFLYEMGAQLHANAQREHLSIAVAMIDIDFFKKVNDRYGHKAGDVALKVMADVLRKNLRKADVITRYGGEEFCIVLVNSTLENAQKVMEKIRLAIKDELITCDEISFRINISVGISDELGNSLDAMIASADKLLYEAKKSGRDQVISSRT